MPFNFSKVSEGSSPMREWQVSDHLDPEPQEYEGSKDASLSETSLENAVSWSGRKGCG